MKTYIQIGAGAGDRDSAANFTDGFSGMVKAEDPATVDKIILVEPNPINIPFLKECWQDYPQTEIYQIGICPIGYDSVITFYSVVGDGPHYQMTSALKGHTGQTNLTEFQANCETLTNFLNRTVGNSYVDVLALDIEGLDGDVILDTDWSNFNVDRISFEHLTLKNADVVVEHLKKYNYEHVGDGLDRANIDWMYQKKKDIDGTL